MDIWDIIECDIDNECFDSDLLDDTELEEIIIEEEI